jgi:inorganic pyrophosphatase
MHPWHHISPGSNIPHHLNAIIEIPKGSRAKYEIDKTTGLIKLDRVLYGSMMYPLHYGIIPRTLFDDGDPLDVMLITQVPLVPLTLVEVRLVGVMRMLDNNIPDDKLLAVPLKDNSTFHIHDIQHIPETFLDELRNFFENYTKLEGKTVVVPSFLDKNTAHQILVKSCATYIQQYG